MSSVLTTLCVCPVCGVLCLQRYTNQGLRVIAMAWREVQGLSHPSQVLGLSQDALELNTQMLGLVLMVNK